MSWESTAHYYALINKHVRMARGGLASAPILLRSFDFAEIAALQTEGRWDRLSSLLAERAVALERAGADAVLLATNTMHRCAPAIEDALGVPFLHIANPLAAALQADGHMNVGLLATKFAVEQPFLIERLTARGLSIRLPGDADRTAVHRIIFEELCQGEVCDASREMLVAIIGNLIGGGVTAIALACTELTLLVRPQDCPVALFDTAALHAQAAARFVLGESASARA